MALQILMLLIISPYRAYAETRTVAIYSYRQPYLIEPLIAGFETKTEFMSILNIYVMRSAYWLKRALTRRFDSRIRRRTYE